jgi:alkanesulfonate monooxygenase SsuD/methylene tetrahydromethanopterin reductase-like flavin-dependent oxidoreductase (luciferase family)
VIVADTPEAAEEGHRRMKVNRIKRMYARGGRPLTDDEVEQLLASGAAQQIEQMIQYTAVGTPAVVKDYLDGFQKHADADELIVAHQFGRTEARLRSVELLAQAMAPADA